MAFDCIRFHLLLLKAGYFCTTWWEQIKKPGGWRCIWKTEWDRAAESRPCPEIPLCQLVLSILLPSHSADKHKAASPSRLHTGQTRTFCCLTLWLAQLWAHGGWGPRFSCNITVCAFNIQRQKDTEMRPEFRLHAAEKKKMRYIRINIILLELICVFKYMSVEVKDEMLFVWNDFLCKKFIYIIIT